MERYKRMQREKLYDVIVVGGGSAGVAAAIGAAQAGAGTLLLERNPYLGGEATHMNVNTYAGFHTRGDAPAPAVAGVGRMVLQQIEALGFPTAHIRSASGNNIIRIDPEAVKLALDRLMLASDADFALHCSVADVSAADGRIRSLLCSDDDGLFRLFGKTFVDCTGNANLAHLSGAETLLGDEDGKLQISTLSMRIDNFSEDADISEAAIHAAVQKGRAAGIPHLGNNSGWVQRIGSRTLINLLISSVAHQGLSCEQLTEEELTTRMQAQCYMEALRRFCPGLAEARLVSTGPSIGIREGRRIVGRDTVTKADVQGCTKRHDAVARCAWSAEIHRSTDEKAEFRVQPDHEYFDIPMGAIRAKDIDNLFMAGRTISADPLASACVRVMGTAFATGHAAGVAAALHASGCGDDYAALKKELLRQNALL